MKQELVTLEYMLDAEMTEDDLDIGQTITSDLDNVYINYKILDFKVNIIKSADISNTDYSSNYVLILYSILVEFEDYKIEEEEK